MPILPQPPHILHSDDEPSLDALKLRARAMSAAGNGIVIADASLPDYPIVYANPAFLTLSGYAEAEVVGFNCRFLQGPETDPETVLRIREAVQEQRAIQVMILNYHKNGTPFWNEITISPMRDARGTVTHFIGVQTNVTERIAAERQRSDLLAALTAGQEQFQAVQDGMADGLIVADKEGNVLTMNTVALRLFGYDGVAQVQRHVSEFADTFLLHSPDGEVLPPEEWPLARALGGEQFSDYEVRVTRRDTGKSWIGSYSGASLSDREGRPFRAIVSLRDVTERRAADETVHLFQHLSDNANDEFFLVDAAGCFTYVNGASCRALGYTPEQMRGMHVSVISPAYEDAQFAELFARAAREAVSPFETLHRRADGTTYSAESSVSIIHLGAEPLLLSIARDITERKAAAAKLAELYEREHRIAESLQRSLLTRPTQEILGGLEVETVYRPAWDEAQVGGDYYDVFALEGGRVALVVGDVSGKGLEAASRTAEIKFTLRAYLREYSQAAAALTRLNAFLCEAQSLEADAQEYFVVMSLMIVETRTGRVAVALAGAESPIVLRADGTLEEANTWGAMPLGIASKEKYEEIELHLAPGDLILAATDGITEARHGREFLGNDGMARLAQEAQSEETLARIGQAILSGVQSFAQGRLHDDVCLLLARRV